MNHEPELACRLQGRRETNGVVEGETDNLVDVFTALIVKQILLEVIPKGKEWTTLG